MSDPLNKEKDLGKATPLDKLRNDFTSWRESRDRYLDDTNSTLAFKGGVVSDEQRIDLLETEVDFMLTAIAQLLEVIEQDCVKEK